MTEHGIQTEKAQWRAHVSFTCHEVYFFKTEKWTTTNKKYLKTFIVSAPHANCPTGAGYLWPIDQCGPITVPWMETHKQRLSVFPNHMSHLKSSWRGRAAVSIVTDLIRAGKTPLTGEIRQPSLSEDRSGIDLWVGADSLQIKADCICGPKPNGSGNLCIQTQECNPTHAH